MSFPGRRGRRCSNASAHQAEEANEMPEHDDDHDRLPSTIAAPARRALVAAGVTRLDDLTYLREDQLLALHGMGPKAVSRLRAVLCERGKSFAAAPNPNPEPA
jgi:hypothetical protein